MANDLARRARRATYRLQLGPDLTFADAAALVPQLAELGVSHLYLSPIAEAIDGSTHGYDVTEPDRIRDELGGAPGFGHLCETSAAHDLGLVVDIVPNHLSVAEPEANPLWWEVLRLGRASTSAAYFDIDWDANGGRVILPVLGTDLEAALAAGAITVVDSRFGPVLDVDGLQLPVSPGTEHLDVATLVRSQHYELVPWQSDERNVRRFFTIDELVAVRVEHGAAAELVDALPARLYAEGRIDGVRVDHVDGLADQAGYLTGLRRRLPGGWILVEKILAADERTPEAWPVDGTTGYDALRVVDHVLVDPQGAAPLTDLWSAASGDERSFEQLARAARQEVLDGALRPDLERTAHAVAAQRTNLPIDDVTDALAALTVEIPRYRTYLPHDPDAAEIIGAMATAASKRRPDRSPAIIAVAGLLTSATTDAERSAVARWQQLCAPVVAKGDEDRAFYRYHRLVALCEVGGDPGAFGVDLESFHEDMIWRAEHRPHALIAGTTHDTKRAEDVRARLLTLSETPDRWGALVGAVADELDDAGDSSHPVDRYLALQTAVGAWPLESSRLRAFLVKAAREADVRTSWTDPDAGYERALEGLATRLVEHAGCRRAIDDFVETVAPAGWANALAQLTLRCTIPGVPDVYQGCESWNDGLVDPDNRRRPDFETLCSQISMAQQTSVVNAWDRPESGLVKTTILHRLLALRAARPEPFAGAYRPLPVDGESSERIVAFSRNDDVAVVVTRWPMRNGGGLADTTVALGPGSWRNVLTDQVHRGDGAAPVARLVGPLPVAVLARD